MQEDIIISGFGSISCLGSEYNEIWNNYLAKKTRLSFKKILKSKIPIGILDKIDIEKTPEVLYNEIYDILFNKFGLLSNKDKLKKKGFLDLDIKKIFDKNKKEYLANSIINGDEKTTNNEINIFSPFLKDEMIGKVTFANNLLVNEAIEIANNYQNIYPRYIDQFCRWLNIDISAIDFIFDQHRT